MAKPLKKKIAAPPQSESIRADKGTPAVSPKDAPAAPKAAPASDIVTGAKTPSPHGHPSDSRQKIKQVSSSLILLFGASFTILFLVTLIAIVSKDISGSVLDAIQANFSFFVIFMTEIIFVILILLVSMGAVSGKSDPAEAERGAFNKRQIVLIVVSAFFVAIFLANIVFALSGILPYSDRMMMDLVIFTILSAVAPLGFYEAYRLSVTREMEAELPVFLRDIAEYTRAGMTLVNAVHAAGRNNYGLLTPHVRKLSNQLTWGIHVDDALQTFAYSVGTPLVKRSVILVIEATRSGGNMADVLLAAANDIRDIQEISAERSASMSTYTAIIYVAFFVFMAVVGILAATFLPALEHTSKTAVSGPGGGGPTLGGGVDVSSILNIYYLSSVVQGFGSGLLIGVLGSGRIVDGFKHSVLMVLISVFVFRLFL